MKQFNWGNSDGIFRETITKELFDDNIYTKIFDVEEEDVVFDIGASIGPFTYSIIDRNPSQIFCFEPSVEEFELLVKNTNHGPVTYINKGISDVVGEMTFDFIFQTTDEYKSYSTTFSKVIEDYGIKKIDFLKTDCEGGEYDIFNIENLFWIKENVKKISGEWHMRTPELKKKFRIFRDIYLRVLPNFRLFSIDGLEITNYCWGDEFIEYYDEIYVHIDNKKGGH
jgi:FkbM family methyltransferase